MMDAAGITSIRNQRICLGSGLAFVCVFFAGIILAGWMPPLSADHTADEIAQMYRNDAGNIRAGAILIGASTVFQGIWAALISAQMRRIEHGRPLLTYLQLGGGAVGVIVPIIPAFAFGAAAFDPGRDAEITKAINDFAWLSLVGIGWPTFIQCLALALVVFSDTSEKPVFPRWFGYANVWVLIGLLPGPLVIFFHAGPLAWNGLLAFWIPGTVFVIWFGICTHVLRHAINAEAEELRTT